MKVAYFDCFSGVSGDMFVGALLDAGCDAKALLRGLAKLPVKGYRIEIRKEKRGGFAGTRFDVIVSGRKESRSPHHEHEHHHDHDHQDHDQDHDHAHAHSHSHEHRTLREVELILKKAKLPKPVFDRAWSAFSAIAQVEGQAHGISPQKVHFHEVGAIDAIVDIVAAAYALELMGIEEIYSSALPMGTGFVHCDHGKVPVPAPGTMGLMQAVPVRMGGPTITGELVTPTGAALLTSWAKSIGEPVDLIPGSIGYGAGKRDRGVVANLLRVVVGEKADPAYESDQIYLLEANLDDMPGEMIGYAMEQLLEAGALDAYLTPIHMKKNRPGVILSAIVAPANRLKVEEVFFRETTTLGVRRQLLERTKLRREIVSVKTSLGVIPCKISYGPGSTQRISPEYEALREMAKRLKTPLPELVHQFEKSTKTILSRSKAPKRR